MLKKSFLAMVMVTLALTNCAAGPSVKKDFVPSPVAKAQVADQLKIGEVKLTPVWNEELDRVEDILYEVTFEAYDSNGAILGNTIFRGTNANVGENILKESRNLMIRLSAGVNKEVVGRGIAPLFVTENTEE